MNNAKNNQQAQASFCIWVKNDKQQKRPTVELKLSDLTKTVRL